MLELDVKLDCHISSFNLVKCKKEVPSMNHNEVHPFISIYIILAQQIRYK